jgi:hypothetical protein
LTQYYRSPTFSLANAKLHTKVLVTLFLLTVLGGLGIAWLQYTDRAGTTDRGATEWVLGNEDDPAPTEFKEPKSYRELLALTHDHAFSLPLLVFVLLHLVALTPMPAWSKIALYAAGFGSLTGALGAPWLVAYVSPDWAWLLRASGVMLFATIALSVLVCLVDMWLLAPLARLRGAAPRGPADPLNIAQMKDGRPPIGSS